MIKCQVCGYENPDDATVCLNCGATIERPKMGAAIDDISGEATVLLGGPPPSPRPSPPPPAAAPPPPPPPPPRPAMPPPPSGSAPPPPPPGGWQQPQQPQQHQQYGAPPPQQYGGGAPMPPPGQFGGPQMGPPMDMPNGGLYIGLSIFQILCCCWPLGIASLIFSIIGKNAEGASDYQKAADNYGKAKICLIIGFVAGAIVGVLYFLMAIASEM